MKIIQGFVSIPELVDNRVGVIAKFGEFSTHSATFTKDIRNLSDTNLYPHIEIITVKAIDEKSGNIDIPKDISMQMMQVTDWIYNQYAKAAIPTDASKQTLEAAIANELPFATLVKVNQILSVNQANKRLPDNIRFDLNYESEQYRITLWFSDERFRVQYRYYEIEVIPPVDDINRLIDTLANVAVALAGTKTQSITNRINAKNREAKFTELQTMTIPWHSPLDKNSKATLNTEWTLVIYGNAGSDTDAIKAAIQEYLFKNSDYKDWAKIFPTLFSSNEFILVPLWDAIAAPKSTYDDGLYTSLVTTGIVNLATYKYFPIAYRTGNGSPEFLALNTTVGHVFYRSMMFIALGNPSNRDGIYTIEHLFKDYMSISTESPDFARMSPKTQSFALKLNDCFNKARLYTPNEKFPEGYTLALKGAREHIGFDFEGFTFFVMTRLGYLREI